MEVHVVEENKPPHPLDVGVFSADAVVPDADRVPQSVEQFRFLGRLSACRR